jgi:hypothetical protein
MSNYQSRLNKLEQHINRMGRPDIVAAARARLQGQDLTEDQRKWLQAVIKQGGIIEFGHMWQAIELGIGPDYLDLYDVGS